MRSIKSGKDQIREKMTLQYRLETGVVPLEIRHNRVLGLFIEVPSRFSHQLNSLGKFVFRQELGDRKRYRTMVMDLTSPHIVYSMEPIGETDRIRGQTQSISICHLSGSD